MLLNLTAVCMLDTKGYIQYRNRVLLPLVVTLVEPVQIFNMDNGVSFYNAKCRSV